MRECLKLRGDTQLSETRIKRRSVRLQRVLLLCRCFTGEFFLKGTAVILSPVTALYRVMEEGGGGAGAVSMHDTA